MTRPPLAATSADRDDAVGVDPACAGTTHRDDGTRPLRVAMVTTFYPPLSFGGDAHYVRRLAHGLARRGAEVEVIHDQDAWRILAGSMRGSPVPPPLAEPAGVTVHRLASAWPLGATLLTHQLGRPVVHGARLRALLGRDIDVIHYHNVSLVGGPAALAMGRGIKLYTAHEHWLVCPTHVLWRHNRELCTGRECVRCTLAHRRPPQLWRSLGTLERAGRHVDAFIALSRSVADNHRAFGFPQPMRVMASFLPDAEKTLAAESAVTAAGRPYFLYVGRLEFIKGLQDVIPLFDGRIDADLVIAGSGDYEPALRQQAAGRKGIRFLGRVPHDELGRWCRGAVALVTPSLCYEVFPMVALEAFSVGTPIVARRLGPFPQIVDESGGGLLFDDPASLRAALERLLADRAYRDRLGAGGRHAVETRWCEATALGDYLALVRELAEQRGRRDIVERVARLATPVPLLPL